jgi:hypothetical protein
MAVKTVARERSKPRKPRANEPKNLHQSPFFRHLPAWFTLTAVLIVFIPNALGVTLSTGGRILQAIPDWVGGMLRGPSPISMVFMPSVQYWAEDIVRWSDAHGLDPNLLATIMQIESCGHPTVGSNAGAQGLFQVMPFHFTEGENYVDPETNAFRGASFLRQCLNASGGDVGLAMACYNGGQSLVTRPYANWPNESQRFHYWGTGIYAEATANQGRSTRLDEWLAAGGGNLCTRADGHLGL